MNIKDNAFRRLINLQQLDLDSNHITTVRGSWFEGLDYLTYLDLGYNDISVIEDDVFKNLPNLVDLRLSGNNLECLNLEAMSHLYNLRRIFLSENKEMKCPNAISAFLESRGVIFERDPEWRRIPVDLVRAGMQQVEHPASPVYVVPEVTVRTPIEATTHESHLHHETLHRESEADRREHPMHYPIPETSTYVHPIHYPIPERTTAYTSEIHYSTPERTTTYAPEIHYPIPERTTAYAPEVHYPIPERTTAYAPSIHYVPSERTTTYSSLPHYPTPETITAPPMHYPKPETTTTHGTPISYPTYERTTVYTSPMHYPTLEGTTTYTPPVYPRFESTSSNPPMHYPTTARTTSSMSHERSNENLETTPSVPVMHYPTPSTTSYVHPTHYPYPETSPSIPDTRHNNLKSEQESESHGSEINQPPPEIDPSMHLVPETSPSSSEHDESDQYEETDTGSQYYDYYDPYDPTPFQLPIPTDESEQETPAPVDQTTRTSTWRYNVGETPPLPTTDESVSKNIKNQTYSIEESETSSTQSITPDNSQTSDVYTQKPSPSHADTITKTEHPSVTARENEFHRHPHLPSEATWPSMLAPSPTERSETPTSFMESNVARATGLPSIFWTEDTDEYNGEIDHDEYRSYDQPTESSGSETTHMIKSYEPALPPDMIHPASPDDFFQAPYDEPTVTIRPPSTLQNYRQRENAMPVQPMDLTTTTTDKPLPDCAGGMTSIFRSLELIVICAIVANFQHVLVAWV